MELDWVKRAIEQTVGFSPYPGTLNVSLQSDEDKAVWGEVKSNFKAIEIRPADSSFCPARLYPAEVEDPRARGGKRLRAAVLVPGVEGYPENKIEVVAPVRLKESLGLDDGDELMIELGAF